MLALALLILAAVVGVTAHWYNRWYQGRTSVDFWCYMFKCNISDTIHMLLWAIGSEVVFFRSLPPDISVWSMDFFDIWSKQVGAAFIIDSVANSDGAGKSIAATVSEKLKSITRKDAGKSPDDLLKDDASL